MVEHCHIEFYENPPVQLFIPNEIKFSVRESEVIEAELIKLLKKQVIEVTDHGPTDFISNIFIRSKRNGGYRVILNLSKLNESVTYRHFKMETLDNALQLVRPNCYMASVDLKDAYYSVSIAEEHRNLLKFSWRGKLYRFTCLPNGLACAPRFFTKLLKPVFAYLRSLGHCSVIYIDDSFLCSATAEDCFSNVKDTVKLLTDLGFTINQEKSNLFPSQSAKFLGFIIDSRHMTVKLTNDKVTQILKLSRALLSKQKCTITELASFIGTLVAAFPGVQFGPIYYRSLERLKSFALTVNAGNYDASVNLNQDAKFEINWWIQNISNAFKPIKVEPHKLIIHTDASSEGWGAVSDSKSANGRWNDWESKLHINVLELKAALFGLKSLAADQLNTHVRLKIDNTTAVAYINNMGGCKSPGCNSVAREIWEWGIFRSVWISAEHLPGANNCLADKYSRIFDDNTEWTISFSLYKDITVQLAFDPTIDLFASRLNAKCSRYVSWKPDPGAEFIDAFSSSWSSFKFYAFPPFSLVNRCLQKVALERSEGIILVPLWPTQVWFPCLIKMIISSPVLLPTSVLALPFSQKEHPLEGRLRLLACLVSGVTLKAKDFRRRLLRSSCHPGDLAQNRSTVSILKDGIVSVVDKLPIRLIPLKVQS